MSGIGKSLRLLYFSKIRTKATHPLCFDEFSLFTNNWTYEGESGPEVLLSRTVTYLLRYFWLYRTKFFTGGKM